VGELPSVAGTFPTLGTLNLHPYRVCTALHEVFTLLLCLASTRHPHLRGHHRPSGAKVRLHACTHAHEVASSKAE
jgi:hypothetical protein